MPHDTTSWILQHGSSCHAQHGEPEKECWPGLGTYSRPEKHYYDYELPLGTRTLTSRDLDASLERFEHGDFNSIVPAQGVTLQLPQHVFVTGHILKGELHCLIVGINHVGQPDGHWGAEGDVVHGLDERIFKYHPLEESGISLDSSAVVINYSACVMDMKWRHHHHKNRLPQSQHPTHWVAKYKARNWSVQIFEL